MTGGRLGVSSRPGGLAAVWPVMRGGLEVTLGAGTEVPAEPAVSLRMADGSEVRRLLRDVRARQVAAAVPWRAARSARGQSHYPGFYWSETTVPRAWGCLCLARGRRFRLLPGGAALAALVRGGHAGCRRRVLAGVLPGDSRRGAGGGSTITGKAWQPAGDGLAGHGPAGSRPARSPGPRRPAPRPKRGE
jgi:hypothetical protein